MASRLQTGFFAGDLPPALRRLVVEGEAGVERALKARKFDATACGANVRVLPTTRRRSWHGAHAREDA
jgi:hypothetical protein